MSDHDRINDEAAARLNNLVAERDRLKALINTPELVMFLRAVHIEAVHQVERWGEASDRAKRPADWFWLVGYLAGKALHAAIGGNVDKARHHCISTAAALYNWHCAISGTDVRMCPGRSDVALIVDGAFPGEAPEPSDDSVQFKITEITGAMAARNLRIAPGADLVPLKNGRSVDLGGRWAMPGCADGGILDGTNRTTGGTIGQP